jgi:hypothetical protein
MKIKGQMEKPKRRDKNKNKNGDKTENRRSRRSMEVKQIQI